MKKELRWIGINTIISVVISAVVSILFKIF